MTRIKKVVFFGGRAQLHTAEVVIALLILLVISLTIINATQDLVGPQESSSWLKERGQQILEAADSSGLLRPAIYLASSPQREQAINDLKAFIDASLDNTIIYAVTKSEFLQNGTIQESELLIGSSITFSQNQQSTVVIANYFLSGFSNASIVIMRPVIVNLYLMPAS